MKRPSAPRGGLLAAALLLAGAAGLSAHDFWIVPEMYRVPEGWTLHAAGQTGMEFPKSTAAIGPDRVASAALVSAEDRIPVSESSMARSGNSLMLEARPPEPGRWWVAVALEPRPIELDGRQFNRYLEHDGVWDVLERRRARGDTGSVRDTVRERYAKFAKALVRVGEGGSEAHGRPVGHPIEFVSLSDPFSLRPGEEFRARLLWRGEPLAGETVLVGRAGAGEAPTAQVRTDERGVASFPLFVAGQWYVKAIQMVESDRPDFDYESYWATLTFRVQSRDDGG